MGRLRVGHVSRLALLVSLFLLCWSATSAIDVPGDPDSLPGWQGEKAERVTTKAPTVDRSRIIQLSADKPRAYLYKNFLSDAECDHLISKANPNLERSMVAKDLNSSGEVSEIRTSLGTFLAKGSDPIVKAIEERIEEWTFLPIANQEPLQILRYLKGQKYVSHFDYFPDDPKKQVGGQRYATVLMYLSNVKRGGETVFTNAPDTTPKDDTWSECAKGYLAVKPSKGDAVLFFSMHPDGSPDTYSLHYACPVVEGVKWSAPKWIHVRSYEVEVPNQDPSICQDSNALCDHWASVGECTKNPKYMVGSSRILGACRKACKTCANKVEAKAKADDAPVSGDKADL
jgi:prolyl 4-hydroxylase